MTPTEDGLAPSKRTHEFLDLPLREIVTSSKERMREEYGDIDALADSIRRNGLLMPIIVDKNNRLIAGGRRTAAHAHLGIPSIQAKRYLDLDTTDPNDALIGKELELLENLDRLDLHWTEEVRGRRDIFRLRQEIRGARLGRGRLEDSGGYGIKEAADEFHLSPATMSIDVRLADGLERFPELKKETSKTSALARLKALETKVQRESDARGGSLGSAEAALFGDEAPPSGSLDPQAAADAAKMEARKKAGLAKKTFKSGILYFGDSVDICKTLPDGVADLLLTDPPFGLDMYKEGERTSGGRLAELQGHAYDDSHDKVMDTIDRVLMESARILKPTGQAYIFFHMRFYEKIRAMIERHFGEVNDVPLIWSKNTSGIGNPNKNYVYSYEPCFFVSRGQDLIVPQGKNVLSFDTIPPKDKIHVMEKPTTLLRHLILASSVKGEVVFDPFAGSGSTLLAAKQTDRKFMGIEKEEPFWQKAADRLLAEDGTPEA